MPRTETITTTGNVPCVAVAALSAAFRLTKTLLYHHSYSPCLAEQLGDTGAAHSPIHGWAADGYPIYGAWQAAGQLAQRCATRSLSSCFLPLPFFNVPTPALVHSCWKTRDYSSASSPTGCLGTGAASLVPHSPTTLTPFLFSFFLRITAANARTCVLKNPLDYTQGTTTVTAGPGTTTTVLSLSSNTIPAVSGVYYEVLSPPVAPTRTPRDPSRPTRTTLITHARTTTTTAAPLAAGSRGPMCTWTATTDTPTPPWGASHPILPSRPLSIPIYAPICAPMGCVQSNPPSGCTVTPCFLITSSTPVVLVRG